MTSLTDQFLNQLRAAVQQKSESPMLPTTSPTLSGESSSDASFTDRVSKHNMLKPSINGVQYGWAEAVGVVLGMVLGGLLSALIGAWIITWILGLISIGNLTFGQVFGLLVIWALIKPYSK